MKRNILRNILCAAVAALLLAPASVSAAASSGTPGNIRLPFRDLSAEEITNEMGLGWNLGNTMDGHSAFMPSETAWQSVVTTSGLIDAVHDAGFNTVRIPVTWGLMIDDDNNYTIDNAWMSRVREIAEYCLRQDMYVIINIHHDGAEQTGWLRVAAKGEELEAVKVKFARVWEQIASVFSGYDEHVIFESMNEVKSDEDSKAGILRDFQVIGDLNQIFVDTVRSAGGNNTRRWLLVPGRYTNIVNTTKEENGFALPADPWNEENRLMVSVHDYDYTFGLVETMGITNWSGEKAEKMANNFQLLIDDFTSKGVPVVLGEYGAVNKNNTQERAYYYEVMARLSRLSGVVCCAWDNGWYDLTKEPDYSMALFDRATGEEIYPKIIRAILRGYYGADETAGLKDFRSIVCGTKDDPAETTPVSSISLSTNAVSLAAGSSVNVTAEVLPAETNEAVLYSTSDPSVATVYDGFIRAKGIGRCIVSAYSQSGDVREQIEVTVYPDETLSSPLKSIETDADAYTLAVSATDKIEVVMPEGADDTISFTSSDPDVVAVSKLGTLTGKSEGAAFVALATRSGPAKTVRVDVTKAISPENSLEVAINAYYNDSEHSFYNNCEGEKTTVAGNGTYTLTFDCAMDLSEEAAAAGVTSLAGVGAIYLKDIEGRNGLLDSCDIFYDEIILDGEKLTITQTEPKTALKAGKRFDTNDPVNAWDGSSVAEATAEDYVITFEGNPEPKTITVTFTLSNFVLARDAEQEAQESVPAEISLSEDSVSLDSAGAVPYTVTLSPEDTTDTACFVSGDPGVVWVSPVSVGPDKKGRAAVELIPIGPGDAAVSVRTQSGETKEFAVTVTVSRPALDGTMDVYAEPSAYVLPEPTDTMENPEPTPLPSMEEPALPADTENAESGVIETVLFAALLGAAGGAVVLGGIVLAVWAYMRKKKK
jgi:aryl-phospho-beta-D-glucosidase BglC (GH1 family)